MTSDSESGKTIVSDDHYDPVWSLPATFLAVAASLGEAQGGKFLYACAMFYFTGKMPENLPKNAEREFTLFALGRLRRARGIAMGKGGLPPNPVTLDELMALVRAGKQPES